VRANYKIRTSKSIVMMCLASMRAQLHAAIASRRTAAFKPLRQAAQGSTEQVRSQRNSAVTLVRSQLSVLSMLCGCRMQSKRSVQDLNDRVGVIPSSETKRARVTSQLPTELFAQQV
jgi:hypothetical protein